MAHGRAVILGDAAFVARPHVGMGVTKAALDAECLADAIMQTGDIDAALARIWARKPPSRPRPGRRRNVTRPRYA